MARARKQAANDENARPMPPADFGAGIEGPSIIPAKGMRDWIIRTFLEEGAPLFNPDHQHLLQAPFECLWAAAAFTKQGRIIVGQAEEIAYRVSGWQKWRQEDQIKAWFGYPEPVYLLTFAADYCREADDTAFCALVEHEMFHIGHKRNEMGEPAFTKEGLPKLGIRGHDVEEFVGVVERYGAGHPDGAVARLVAAANKQPTVRRLDIQHACGTCLLRAA